MEITIDRFISDDDSTVSRVSIDGAHECFGLEDEYREEKISGETRIPAGVYRIGIRRFGGFHSRYAKRFAEFHQGMLEILDVPNFTDILLHCGNTEKQTVGCLLIGASVDTTIGSMYIGKSRVAYSKFYPKVIQAAILDVLQIEFIDSDR